MLTDRQVLLLRLTRDGLDDLQIAARLGLTPFQLSEERMGCRRALAEEERRRFLERPRPEKEISIDIDRGAKLILGLIGGRVHERLESVPGMEDSRFALAEGWPQRWEDGVRYWISVGSIVMVKKGQTVGVYHHNHPVGRCSWKVLVDAVDELGVRLKVWE